MFSEGVRKKYTERMNEDFADIINMFQRREQNNLLIGSIESDESHGRCNPCKFEQKPNGSRMCLVCGVIEEKEEEDLSGLITKSAYRRGVIIDHDVEKFLQRSELGNTIQSLADANKGRVRHAELILYYANIALEEVNRYRTQFKMKGETPIKLVAILTAELSAGTCITKDEVVTLFGLEGKNLRHAQAMLNDYREQFQLFNCARLIKQDDAVQINDISIKGADISNMSDLAVFLSHGNENIAKEDIELAERIYELLDSHRIWTHYTEPVRFKITASLLLNLEMSEENQKKESSSPVVPPDYKLLLNQRPELRNRVPKGISESRQAFVNAYIPFSGHSNYKDASKELSKYEELWKTRESLKVEIEELFSQYE